MKIRSVGAIWSKNRNHYSSIFILITVNNTGRLPVLQYDLRLGAAAVARRDEDFMDTRQTTGTVGVREMLPNGLSSLT
jgi:hypothetical protein